MRRQTFFAFDTVCVIGGVMGLDTLDEAVRYCADFETLFSRTIPESDVSRINDAGGKPVEVAPETAELVSNALYYCEQSGGLFDITIGSVSSLWDFSQGIVPDAHDVAEALAHVDFRMVEVGDSSVLLADAMAKLDLGGIAKGYIADKVAGFLEARGVESAFVNLGGNVKVIGAKDDGSAWRIGVRDPESDDDSDTIARVSSYGGSLVTSGLYERCFEVDGKRYWHILDPRTGYPVESNVLSASIYSESSLDGDGFTKPLFFLEPNEGLEFARAHGGFECLLVLPDGTQVQSSGNVFDPSK